VISALTAVFLVAVSLLSAGGDSPRELATVEVSPTAVRLSGPYSYVQMVLTGVRRDGARVDVTREARLIGGDDLVSVNDRGLVRPLRDGVGDLVFVVGEHEVRVPLEVSTETGPRPTSFVRDVMPILSRLGCNTGTCHGSADGQNGFKLSLRGYDAITDHRSLTDDLAGRRFNRVSSAQSLFLQKPTGEVPHEGGRRLAVGDPDYDVLKSWVEGGVAFDAETPRVTGIELTPDEPTVESPGMAQQFRVIASYSDGARRDVTAHAFFETSDLEVMTVDEQGLATTVRRGDAAILARYEGRYAATRVFVMGDRRGFEWQELPENNYIDSLVYGRLQEIKALPSELCSDAEFARRVYLDLTGRAPTRKQTRAFLLDERDSKIKRDELIDRLIGGAEFIEHWTNRWASLLQVNSEFLGDAGAERMREWIRRRVASNAPYDSFVRELLTARGSTVENPAASYYKVLREPDAVMENTTQLFLGVRFNCNKCHDHPFERWTKDQHWQMASYFARVQREDVPGSKKMPGRTVMTAKQPPAYDEVISDADTGDATDPEGRSYEPEFPYSHGETGSVGADTTRREQLAAWLTSADNDYFARSYVNRLWSYLTGVGLIDPVDDIRASNPPTLPDLLDALTDDFIEGGFDVRRILRRICRSRVYQHSIKTNKWNEDDRLHYARALPKRLPAEVLFDAIYQAVGSRPRLPGVIEGTGARELVDASVKLDDGFLDLFGRPARETACECERESGMSLGHALNLINGSTVAEAIQDPDNWISQLVASVDDPRPIVTDLYLGFLCRPPTDAELSELVRLFDVGDPANLDALNSTERARVDRALQEWTEKNRLPEWTQVQAGNLKSDGGAEFVQMADGSVLVRGPAPDKDRYTVVLSTDEVGITGLRLEVLPDESLAAEGPGRAKNGNFVLARVSVTAVPLGDPSNGAPVELARATADFSQSSWSVADSIVDSDKGWGVADRFGRRHVAYYEVKGAVGVEGGTLLIVKMDQPHGSKHTIGRFRWSVTTADRPVRYPNVPASVLSVLAKPESARTEADRQAIYRSFIDTQPSVAAMIRLGAAQDLAWSLANSSAFLFNR